MPRVPVLDAPSVGQSPLAAPQASAPPAAAFGAPVGAALQGLGEEAGRLATDAWHIAVRQQATDAENKTLDKMISLRTEYGSKFSGDAVAAHTETLDSMNKIYEDGKNSIPSRQGQLLFEANAMRSKRIELSGIETHFATERKKWNVETYKDRLAVGAKDLASLAVLSGDDKLSGDVLKAQVAIKIDDLRQVINDQADYRGIDPEHRTKFEQDELRAPVQALMDGLGKTKHPELANLFQQYGGILHKGDQKTVYSLMNDLDIDKTVRETLAGVPRLDGDGNEDPVRGALSVDALVSAKQSIETSNPTNASAILKRLDAEVSRENQLHKEAGDQLEDRVQRIGQKMGPGGSQGIPYGTKEWSDFERLYPRRATVYAAEIEKKGQTRTRFQQEQDRYMSNRSRGAALVRIGEMPDDQVKNLKYENVAAMVREQAPGANGSDIDQVWRHVEQRNSGKPLDPVSKAIPGVVKAGLTEAFGKGSGFSTSLAPDARAYVEDLYAADKNLKPEDLKKQLVTHARELASDSTFFNRKSALTGYKDKRVAPAPAKKAEQKPDFEWDPVTKKLKPVAR